MDGRAGIYEHLLLPGVFIVDPNIIISLRDRTQEKAVFGVYLCSWEELITGISFRFDLLMDGDRSEQGLRRYQGVVFWQNHFWEFSYNHEKYLFE